MNRTTGRRRGAWIVGTLVGGALGICPPGTRAETVASESRDVGGFHAVSIATGGTVTLSRGEVPSVLLEAWPSTLERLETEVVDGELLIRMVSTPRPHGPIRVHIVYPTLDRLVLSGSAEVTTDAITGRDFHAVIQGSADLNMASLTVETLTATVSGSGDLTLPEIAATAAEVMVSGSGNVTLEGEVDTLKASVTGSGSVRGRGLVSQHALAEVRGSGEVLLRAEASLQAEISGSGDIRYLGTPTIDSRISGSGRLRPE